jgi:hypothetical protein
MKLAHNKTIVIPRLKKELGFLTTKEKSTLMSKNRG